MRLRASPLSVCGRRLDSPAGRFWRVAGHVDKQQEVDDTMSTDVAASNSLADLAASIRAEHQGARAAIKRGIEHAMAAGDLLIEAKAQVPHGQWLLWLREHCDVPERTASHYMRLARRRAEIGKVADLTVQEAVAAVARADRNIDPNDDLWGWAEQQAHGPFTDWDLEAGIDWLMTKASIAMNLPTVVAFGLNTMREYDSVPTLVLASNEELIEAKRIIGPYAQAKNGKLAGFRLEVSDTMAATITLMMTARLMFVSCVDELERRRKLKLSYDHWLAEAKQTASEFIAAADAKLAALHEARESGTMAEFAEKWC
jgi:hypothetical protein